MHTSFSQHGIEKKTHAAMRLKARTYAKKLSRHAQSAGYTTPESSLTLPADNRYQNAIIRALTPFKKVSHVVLVGIGGSSLGAEAVYAALAPQNAPTLTVLDGIDGEALETLTRAMKKARSLKDIAIVMVTKSGTTTETLVNATEVLRIFEKQFGNSALKRVICIGDIHTPLHTYAKAQKIVFMEIPSVVGGRFSIFSAAGMVPLALLGIDTVALRAGARDALTTKGLATSVESASTLAAYAVSGTRIVNFFTFNDKLEKLGFWYRQLLAESIGKATTLSGRSFTHALLPVVSTSIDLHSMAQLYLSGYKDIYTRFFYAHDSSSRRLATHPLSAHLPFLNKRTLEEVRLAIKTGVLAAYDEKKLPYQYVELSKIDAHTVGYLLTSLMSEVMLLAHTLEVNAFDQPNVESYKKHARTALA